MYAPKKEGLSKKELIMRARDIIEMEDDFDEDDGEMEDSVVQPKLEINSPGDQFEQHADEVANKLSNNENASELVKNQPTLNSIPQKKEETDNEEDLDLSTDTAIQKKGDEEEKSVMAKSENGVLTGTENLQAKLDSSKGSGQSLDDNTKANMEQNMGVDLSDVKIHTDSKANEMSEGINAKAFTHGQDIYFKSGNYSPNTSDGKNLLGHELAHTVQQKGDGVQRMIQKMDDPIVLTERAKFKGMTLWQITKELGAGYELKKLQQIFFGKLKGKVPAWRNKIISYYLIERGWEADKDTPPQWVEHKYLKDENGNEILLVYTPIPGFLGREAAFGFVRWDLQSGSSKRFYRYQGNREDYDNAKDIPTVKKQEQEGKVAQMGTTTKVEKLFNDTGYAPAQPKAAILLAIALVTEYVTTDYILNPGIGGQGQYLSHKNFNQAKIGGLLSTEKGTAEMGVDIKKKKASRRGDFYTGKGGAFDLKTMTGLRKATSKEVENYTGGFDIFFNDRTTLGIAKEIFIDGNNYSPEQLVEEGIGANMLIRHFGKFKEGIGRAVFFIDAYGKLSPEGQEKAEQAMESYTSTILSAYKNPEDPVDFSKGDALLNDAFAQLYSNVYGEGGLFDKRVEFAKKAIVELKTNKRVSYNTFLIKYIDEAMANKKPVLPTTNSGENPLAKVDLKPLAKIEIALGIIDVMSQITMLGALKDAKVFLGNSDKYYNQFENILMQIGNLMMSKPEGYEAQVNNLIGQGRQLMIDPKYAEGLKVDVGMHNIRQELEAAELKFLLIASVAVAVVGATVFGGWIAGLVAGALAETSLGVTAVAILAVTTEITVSAVTATLLQQTIEAALTGKEWGKDFGKNLIVNFILFGVFKVVEIAVVGRAAIPTGAKLVGNGVWQAAGKNGRALFYLEKGVATTTESVTTITGKTTESLLAKYPGVTTELSQVQSTLKSAGMDPYLIENGLRQSNKATLEFFEKNPGKLSEAAEKLSKELPSLKTLSPIEKVTETAKYLDEFAGPEFLSKFDSKFSNYITQFDNSVTNPTNKETVWRIMRKEQSIIEPISSKSTTGLKKTGDPFTIEGHVRTGSRTETPYISCFTNKNDALTRAVTDGNLKVVEIDLTKFQGKYIDLSVESVRNNLITNPVTRNFAAKSSEFLIITNEIPINAFKVIN